MLQTTLTDNQDERFYVFRVATKHPPLSSTHNKKLCWYKRGERANDSDAKNDDSLLDGSFAFERRLAYILSFEYHWSIERYYIIQLDIKGNNYFIQKVVLAVAIPNAIKMAYDKLVNSYRPKKLAYKFIRIDFLIITHGVNMCFFRIGRESTRHNTVNVILSAYIFV